MIDAFRFPKPAPRAKERHPLKRSGPIRSRRPRRLDRADANPEYLSWVHRQICEVRRLEYEPGYFRIMTKRQAGCWGRIEACHEGAEKPGVSMKSPDGLAICMCRRHHREYTNPQPGQFFGRMAPEDRRAWAYRRGAESQARWLSHGSRRS